MAGETGRTRELGESAGTLGGGSQGLAGGEGGCGRGEEGGGCLRSAVGEARGVRLRWKFPEFTWRGRGKTGAGSRAFPSLSGLCLLDHRGRRHHTRHPYALLHPWRTSPVKC